MKKFVEKHITKAKNKYYSDYFQQHKHSSRKQWEMINTLLNRKRKKTSITKLTGTNGGVINTPRDIVEKFNNILVKLRRN